jgi:hypothetical protein
MAQIIGHLNRTVTSLNDTMLVIRSLTTSANSSQLNFSVKRQGVYLEREELDELISQHLSYSFSDAGALFEVVPLPIQIPSMLHVEYVISIIVFVCGIACVLLCLWFIKTMGKREGSNGFASVPSLFFFNHILWKFALGLSLFFERTSASCTFNILISTMTVAFPCG